MNPEEPSDKDDGIINLTQVVNANRGKDTLPKAPARSLSTEDLTRFDETDNDLSKLVREVVEDLPPESGPPEKAEDIGDIHTERIEAALERVVTRLLSKKIEAMVMDTIEKTVRAEIKKIKAIIKEMAEKGPS